MSYVIAASGMLAAALADQEGVRTALSAANEMAAAPTSGVLVAGADEVSAVLASLFSRSRTSTSASATTATATSATATTPATPTRDSCNRADAQPGFFH
jgi:hypothetical protein